MQEVEMESFRAWEDQCMSEPQMAAGVEGARSQKSSVSGLRRTGLKSLPSM